MTRRKPVRKPVRTKPQGPKFSIRISKEEKDAYLDFIAEVKRRRPYVSGSDVIREHIGLTYTGLITDEMRQKLRERIERIRGRHEEPEPGPPVDEPGGYHNQPEADNPLDLPGHDFPRLIKSGD
jgi:Arc/MetJ-type ribon-helix-helix transcriptional regulator